MKADDDVFVNLFALLKHISDLYTHGVRQRLIACRVFWRKPVRREGKWSIPLEDLPNELYPPYCSGPGYVFSTDVAVALYRVSFYVNFFWVEDAYISGYLPRGLGGAVNHSDMGRAYCGRTRWVCTGMRPSGTSTSSRTCTTRIRRTCIGGHGTTWSALPAVVRPGSLAEQYLPKHVLFPLTRPTGKLYGTQRVQTSARQPS